jgi:hypothetical protein
VPDGQELDFLLCLVDPVENAIGPTNDLSGPTGLVVFVARTNKRHSGEKFDMIQNCDSQFFGSRGIPLEEIANSSLEVYKGRVCPNY